METDRMIISDETLAQWEATEQAATPGPWFVHIFEEQTDWPTVYTYARGRDGDDLVAETYYWQADAFTGHHHLTTVPEATAQANAEFIAMARTAVPALIAEVRRLRESKMQVPMVLGNAVWSHPQILGGRLCVKGTRMPLWVTVEEYFNGMALEDIADNHGLTVDQVQRALDWFGLLPHEPRRDDDDHQ